MPNNQLKHLAIIMDGNRRWAKSKGLSTIEGHSKGGDTFKKICKLCFERDIKILTVYAFSVENWNRTKKEIGYLMKLFKKVTTENLKYFKKNNIKVNIIGKISDLSKDLQEAVRNLHNATKDYTDLILNIAINYGGRVEIVDAIKRIVKNKIPLEKIDEKTVSENIYTADIQDPELIIRTSGEQRLSGFLLWQSPYSELYFPKVCWPDFSEKDLDEAIEWFNNRKRRFGGD
ncbi:di-trans,poly-cis-decaprenylcistransferase [Candidatus Parcubacteria bacterium]|nr:di-trans,poly-cis-decaprenylcistransferase [Candidatus Parcubacteria bacterium]